MMDQMGKFLCNIQQNIDFYYILLLLFQSTYHQPVKCVPQRDIRKSRHTCRDTSLHDKNKKQVTAGPSASTTNVRDYMIPESKSKEWPALKYQEIKSTLQGPGQGPTTISGQICYLKAQLAMLDNSWAISSWIRFTCTLVIREEDNECLLPPAPKG